MQCGPLKDHVYPLLLENTPAVLSVGQMCMLYGYSFYWRSGCKPTLVLPDGSEIELTVESFVPYSMETALRCSESYDTAPSAVEQAPPPGGAGDGVVEVGGAGDGVVEELPQLPPNGRDLKAEAI